MSVGFVFSMYSSQRNVLLFKMGVLNSAKLPSSTRRPSFHPGDPLERKRAISSSIFAREVVSAKMCCFYGHMDRIWKLLAIVLSTYNWKSWCQVGFVYTWVGSHRNDLSSTKKAKSFKSQRNYPPSPEDPVYNLNTLWRWRRGFHWAYNIKYTYNKHKYSLKEAI